MARSNPEKMAEGRDPVELLQELLQTGYALVKEYFADPAGNADKAEFVGFWMKNAGAYSRLLATRANQASITLMLAKMMNLKHDALAPLWRELTGTDAGKYLPTNGERSGGEKAAA